IHLSDQDGNAATVQDEAWQPVLLTPPHPSYVSGHSTFSAAAADILAATFGDDTAFKTYSITLPLPKTNPNDPNEPTKYVERSFTSFSQAAAEAGMSRIYGG